MSIQKEIILRHRSEGHLRFELPASLCSASAAPVIEGELHRIDGVYRVVLYRHQRKLSIRYFDTVTDTTGVARQMLRILNELMEEGLFRQQPQRGKPQAKARPRTGGLVDRLGDSRLGNWVRDKVQEGRETVAAFKVLAKKAGGKQGPALLQNPERSAMEFANDILILYLVKVHWQRIIHEWLPQPLRHRYQWLAVIYMTYLWVRWRHKD